MTATWPSATLSAILSSWAIESVGWSWPALGFGGALDNFLLTPYHDDSTILCFTQDQPLLLWGTHYAEAGLWWQSCLWNGDVCLLRHDAADPLLCSDCFLHWSAHHSAPDEVGRREEEGFCHLLLTWWWWSYSMGLPCTHICFPNHATSPTKDKVFSVFYTIITPLLNPLIYSLRNRDVAEAFKRVLARCRGDPWYDKRRVLTV